MNEKTISTPPSLPIANKESEKKPSYVATLTDSQKSGLLTGTLTVAGVIAGAGLYSLYGQENVPSPGPTPPSPEPCPCPGDEEGISMATNVNDCMNFSEAFTTARGEVGSGGVFEWKNNVYNTYTESEWNCLCDTDKEAFGLAVVKSGYIKETYSDTLEEAAQPIKEAMAWDYDNDGINEVTLEYRGGIRVIKEVDLNNDGHIDVLHSTYEEQMAVENNVEKEEEVEDDTEYSELDTTEEVIKGSIGGHVEAVDYFEPTMGIHQNENGEIDAIAIDEDGDGYADTVLIDYDQDGYEDIILENTDYDLELDIMIIDEDNDGFENDEILEANELVDMNEFLIIEDELIFQEVDELAMI